MRDVPTLSVASVGNWTLTNAGTPTATEPSTDGFNLGITVTATGIADATHVAGTAPFTASARL